MAYFSGRQFIRLALSAGAGILSAGSLDSMLGCASKIYPPAHSRRVLADLHAHPLLDDWIRRSALSVKLPGVAKLASSELNQTEVTWEECYRAGIDVLCVAHFNLFDELASMPTDPNPEAPSNTIRMMDLLEVELEKPEVAQYARLARNYKELSDLLSIPKPNPDYRVAMVHTIEGGHALGGSLTPLDEFARRGVFLITITHFFNKGIASSANALPFFPDSSSHRAYQGLSAFGCEVIKRMEELGIIVDVTHATSRAVEEILRVTQRPVIASHSGVRTLGDHSYNLFDEHIQEIARREGVVGIALYPYMVSNYSDVARAKAYGTLQDVVRTIRYVTKICGTHKHIGIGSDFGGYIPRPKDIKNLGEIDKLRQRLLKEFDDDEKVVEDIMANNVINFMKKCWKSGHCSNEEGC